MSTTIGLQFAAKEAEKTDATEKFKCPHCEKEYAKQDYLKNHMAKKHPEEQNDV